MPAPINGTNGNDTILEPTGMTEFSERTATILFLGIVVMILFLAAMDLTLPYSLVQ